MNLYEQTKKYGNGKDDATMWATIKIVSDALEEHMEEKERKALIRKIYEYSHKGHYNEEYALEDVEKMYFVDEKGEKHYAPYWTASQIKDVYEAVKTKIPSEYNCWDFFVTMQMIKSDNCPLLRKWFPEASIEEMDRKLIELSINWLNDEDNPYGTEKIWSYLNPR